MAVLPCRLRTRHALRLYDIRFLYAAFPPVDAMPVIFHDIIICLSCRRLCASVTPPVYADTPSQRCHYATYYTDDADAETYEAR